jgi:hypothetical protein
MSSLGHPALTGGELSRSSRTRTHAGPGRRRRQARHRQPSESGTQNFGIQWPDRPAMDRDRHSCLLESPPLQFQSCAASLPCHILTGDPHVYCLHRRRLRRRRSRSREREQKRDRNMDRNRNRLSAQAVVSPAPVSFLCRLAPLASLSSALLPHACPQPEGLPAGGQSRKTGPPAPQPESVGLTLPGPAG